MIDGKTRVYNLGTGKRLFAMTADHLEGFQSAKDVVAKVKELGMTDFFQLFDDDGKKYYSGYANLEAMAECDEEYDEFTILDMAMADSGCTDIKFRNKDTKKMESV